MGKTAEVAFGDAVRTERQRVGLTQSEVAKRCKALAHELGMSALNRSHVTRIESGLHEPKLRTMLLMSRALGISLSTLVASLDDPGVA